MEKPTSCVILGQEITIKYVTMKNNHGEAKVAEREIYLDKKLEGDMLQRILAHEKMHIKLGLSGIVELLSDKQEEAICALAESD